MKGKTAVKKKSIVKEIFVWTISLVVLFTAAWLFLHYVGESTQISGESMYPTLSDGDDLVVDKVSYQFTDPGRFDIIVFPFQYQKDTFYIKRIIGLPGETVQISDGKIYINGRLLEEDYGYEEIKNPGLASSPVTLGQDEYFVLGDNRNNSTDSREPSVGNVSRDRIIGRALFRFWPLSGLGFLKQ
ncbi:MAG: signal peptidase I [Lachnospiraceae bacterium]|nr:signal peptidase I [Lachnospiraceae bacterium]